jgi:branched-chain amino acid transport system ATP-binding protein
MTANGPPLLEVDSLTFAYDRQPVVSEVSFKVEEGAAVGLIGPNGAGKSTLVDCLSGALTSYTGQVHFAGINTTRWPAHRCASVGLVRTFQTSRVFASLTAMSNLLASIRGQLGEGLITSIFARWGRAQEPYVREAALTLDSFGLTPVANEPAGSLSGGQRRLLEISRALALRPKLLILDEPFAGVSPVMRERIRDGLTDLRRATDLTILMIEHRLELIEELCDDVIVLANGNILARGSMAALRENPAVVAAYLGIG